MSYSVDQIVQVIITRETKFPSQAGFGVPAILDINVVMSGDTLRFSELSDLTDAGFSTSDQAYLAATALLSQNPRPVEAVILKRAANVAQVDTIVIGGADDGTYTVTINGEAHSFVAASSTITAIRDALVTAINGGGQAALVTAAPVSTDTLTITSDTAGVGFSTVLTSNPNDNMVLTLTTPNTGAASELARLQQIDDDWYFLISTDRTRVFIEQLAAAIEAIIKLYGFETDEADSKNLTPASDTTSLLATLKAANYDRTFGVWTKTANLPKYPAAAWIGLMAPKTPGSATWKFKQVSGPAADDELTGTEITNIQGKNGNLYLTVSNFAMFLEGVVASGEFIDIIRGTDLIQARIQENVFGTLVTEDKVPFDNGGIEALALKTEEPLVNIGVANGILRGGTDAPVVTVPDVSETLAADRANRELKTIEFEGFYAGAVHKVKIEGRLSV